VKPLIPLILMLAVFWLLVIRPQRKRQLKMAEQQRGLHVGDEVMLGSGIFGRITDVQDDTVSLEVAPGTSIKVSKQAVVKVLTQPGDDVISEYDDAEPRSEQPQDTAATVVPDASDRHDQ